MAKEEKRSFKSWQKTIDWAIWLTFKHRQNNIPYGSKPCTGGYMTDVIHTEHENLNDYYKGIYKQMSYDDIKAIRQDTEPHFHWEELNGMFSTMNGESLRFILHTDIPLKKLIRYELSARGFDENHNWCGFDKAEDIWLKQ